MNKILKRFSAMAGVLITVAFFLVFIPAFLWAPVSPAWVPESLRNWAYDMRLAIARPILTSGSLYRSFKGDLAVGLPADGDPFQFSSGELKIFGSIYGIDVDATSKQPAVLIVHGSTPQGRYLGLYRLLMQKLVERGYVVACIDLRGFGSSDDPPDLTDPQSFDFVEDVRSAYFHLKMMPEIDPEMIFLVGHSFGGDVALSAVVRKEQLFKKVAVIGPGRRFLERGGWPGAAEFDYFRRRDMRYMQLRDAIPAEVYLAYRSRLSIENHVGYLPGDTHVPILLIDCELESREDLVFLKNIYLSSQGTIDYYTVAGADHYINVANIGPLVFYDTNALQQLVNVLHVFFSRSLIE